MGIAALILGIVSILIMMIPFCGTIGVLPAIVGLILGIVDIIQKQKASKPRGIAIAGISLSAVAIIGSIIWMILISGTIGLVTREAIDELDQLDQETINEIQDKAYDKIEKIYENK